MPPVVKLKVEPSLMELGHLYLEAKKAENAAREARLKIEQKLVAQINLKDEGTTTVKAEDLTISVNTGYTRKLDSKIVEANWKRLPNAERLLRRKYELEAKEFKYLQENEPDSLDALYAAMTTTPKKPSLTVKVAS